MDIGSYVNLYFITFSYVPYLGNIDCIEKIISIN